MPTIDPDEFVRVMVPALFDAAKLASRAINSVAITKTHEVVPGSESEIGRSARVDVLTEADIQIQEMLLAVVAEYWPFASVLVEEDTPMRAKFGRSAADCILIDPIDGTRNFLSGSPRYCHIVSLARCQDMLATLLYSHVVKKLFVSVRGSGTLAYSAPADLRTITLAAPHSKAFLYHVSRISAGLLRELANAGFIATPSAQNASDILTLLNGECRGFVSWTPLVYDVWSPGMIIQEAGGWLSDWRGASLSFHSKARLPHVLIASSPEVAAVAINILSKYA